VRQQSQKQRGSNIALAVVLQKDSGKTDYMGCFIVTTVLGLMNGRLNLKRLWTITAIMGSLGRSFCQLCGIFARKNPVACTKNT
jgi:hypothetical protein